MRYLLITLLGFMIIFSAGCSSKIEPKNNLTVQENIQNNVADEDFLEDFEDEMKLEEKSDPFSGYNRVMTSFNDGVYVYVFSPISKGYKAVVHKEIRSSIGKFFHNILYPLRLANNLLQGKLKNSGEETGRFLINSTIGILGLFDPAKSYFGLESHNEDFGQTLGYWGVGAGPHIVLPFFGPSNLRDTFALYPNSLLNPVEFHSHRGYNLAHDYSDSVIVRSVDKVNYTSLHQSEYEKLKNDAIDLYPYLRDVYEQYREKQIKE